MRFWVEYSRFLTEYVRHNHTTGSISPSSWFLARALVSEFRNRSGPCRILEVGPGTGSVTQEILRNMGPGDRLDAVEVNERFVALLHGRLDKESTFRNHRDQVRIIHGKLEELTG